MDLTYGEREEAFRREARAWLSANVPARPLPSGDTAEGFALHLAWEKRLFEARWAVVSWPRAYGGREASLFEWLIFEEEYYRAGAPQRVTQNGIFSSRPSSSSTARRSSGTGSSRGWPPPRTSGRRAGPSPTPGATSPASRASPSRRLEPGMSPPYPRRLEALRAEDLVYPRRLLHPPLRPLPQRSQGRAPQGPDLLPRPAPRPRRHRAPRGPARRRRRLRRGLPRRGLRPRQGRARRRARRLERGHGNHGIRARPHPAEPRPLHRHRRPPRRPLPPPRIAARPPRARRPGRDRRRGLPGLHPPDRHAPRPPGRRPRRGSRASTRSSGRSSTSGCTSWPWSCSGARAELLGAEAPARSTPRAWIKGYRFCAPSGPIYAGTNEIQRRRGGRARPRPAMAVTMRRRLQPGAGPMFRDCARDLFQRHCPPAAARRLGRSLRAACRASGRAPAEIGLVRPHRVPRRTAASASTSWTSSSRPFAGGRARRRAGAHAGDDRGGRAQRPLSATPSTVAQDSPQPSAAALGEWLPGSPRARRYARGGAHGRAVRRLRRRGRPSSCSSTATSCTPSRAAPWRLRAQPSVDGSRRLASVAWTPVTSTRFASGEEARRHAAAAFDRGALAAAAELSGIGRWLIDTTVAYACSSASNSASPLAAFRR